MSDKLSVARLRLRKVFQRFQPVKTATRRIYIIDTGDFGTYSCSNCHKTIPDANGWDSHCPLCGAIFTDTDVDYNWGGSDF